MSVCGLIDPMMIKWMRMQSDRPVSGAEGAKGEPVTGDNNLGNLSMQMLIKAIFSVLLGFGLFPFHARRPQSWQSANANVNANANVGRHFV